MDRQWMTLNPLSDQYKEGVKEFIAFAEAFAKTEGRKSILCPCKVCQNLKAVQVMDLESHLTSNGIDPSYMKWWWHGEGESSDIYKNMNTNKNTTDDVNVDELLDKIDAVGNKFSREHQIHYDFRSNAKKPLYQGCTNFTRLSAVFKLFHLKSENKWTDQSFTELLELLNDMLPEDNNESMKYPYGVYSKRMLSLMDAEYLKKKGNSYSVKEFKQQLPQEVDNAVKRSLKEKSLVRSAQPSIEVDFCPRPKFLRTSGSLNDTQKGTGKKKLNEDEDISFDSIPNAIVESLPEACKSLAKFCRPMKYSYTYRGDATIYGLDYEICISRKDILQLFSMGRLSLTCILLYMRYLYDFCHQRNCYQTFRYLYPFFMSEVGLIPPQVDYSSDHMRADDKTCYFVPYVEQEHWMLCVVFLNENRACWLDPFGVGLGVPKDFKQAIDGALCAYRTRGGLRDPNAPDNNTEWLEIKCPMEPGKKKSGFYVMLYMRDIVIGLSHRVRRVEECFHGTEPYSQLQIDELRDQWAKYFLNNYADHKGIRVGQLLAQERGEFDNGSKLPSQ